MRLIHFPTFWTVVLNIIAWLIIHLAVVAFMVRVPKSSFDPNGPLYRPRFWEKRGRFYERWLRIRGWKGYVPDGAEFTKGRGFPKKVLQRRDEGYLEEFFTETCRAELTHWIIILFAPFFFFWNKFWVGWIMIAYALAENLPLIMVQRYNRQRFRRILQKKGLIP
jgi:glycosyl-4,4'-diaponeurosporenoate acyltransferase